MASDILIIPQRGTSNNPVIQFSGSAANTIRLEVLQSGSVAFLGSSGSLFSITDSLVGSLMAVSDISGLPILEVSSDDKVVMGKYNSNALVVTGSNVGIGKAAPNATLDITGSVIITGSVKLPTVYSNTNASGANVYVDSAGVMYRSTTGSTSGTSGANGTSGTSGANGTSGTSGAAGTSGTSGAAGTSGTSGAAGTSGTSGAAGTSGSSGTSGAAGAVGTSGTSGISAASDFSSIFMLMGA